MTDAETFPLVTSFTIGSSIIGCRSAHLRVDSDCKPCSAPLEMWIVQGDIHYSSCIVYFKIIAFKLRVDIFERTNALFSLFFIDIKP